MRTLTVSILFSGLMSLLTCASSNASESEILIQPGDRVKLSVFNHPEFSTENVIAEDGTFTVPYVGSIRFRGTNVAMATALVKKRLLNSIRYPDAMVEITQKVPFVYFKGAINRSTPFNSGETLADAIASLDHPVTAMADKTDLTNVDLDRIQIIHNGRLMAPYYSLHSIQRLDVGMPPLYAGDSILMRLKPIEVSIDGDVGKPILVYLSDGESIADAIARIGGVSSSTSSYFELTRSDKAQLVSITSDVATSAALNGDRLRFFTARRVSITGNVLKPGTTRLVDRPTVLNAIYAAGGPDEHADLSKIIVLHQSEKIKCDLTKVIDGDASQNITLSDDDTIYVPKRRGINAAAFLTALGAIASVRVISR